MAYPTNNTITEMAQAVIIELHQAAAPRRHLEAIAERYARDQGFTGPIASWVAEAVDIALLAYSEEL